MDANDFTEKLDKLNRLKDEGIIDETEYQAQVNRLQKQCLKQNKVYGNNGVGNTTVVPRGSAIGALLFFIIIIIGGIWFFSSDFFEEIKQAGKEFVAIFDEDNEPTENSYNYGTTSQGKGSLGTSSSGTTSSGTSSYVIGSSGTSTSGKGSSGTGSSVPKESKSSYVSSCKNYNSKYEDMKRNPSAYKQKRMKFRGMVEDRWRKNGSTCAFTISACTDDNAYIGMVYCTIDESVLNGKNLLQYDYINVYGEFKGLTENLYTISGYLDYPHLEVKYIELTTY